MKSDFNTSKKERHLLRQHLSESKGDNTSMTLENLEHESIRQHYLMKDRKKYWRKSIAELTGKIAPFEDKISLLKEKRKAMSAALQQKLFDAYSFSNIEAVSYTHLAQKEKRQHIPGLLAFLYRQIQSCNCTLCLF